MTKRLLLINGSDIKGGAAQVAHRLGKGLRGRQYQVTYLVRDKTSNDDWVYEIPANPRRAKRTLAVRAFHRLGINSLSLHNRFPFNLSRNYLRQFDLIHLHDLQGMAFNLAGLAYLSAHCPVAWTIHSAWPATGNCLYPYDCRRYQRFCGKCPQFGIFPVLYLHRDGSRLVNILKRLIYQQSRLYVVGVSQWIADLVRGGMLRRFPQRVITNPAEVDDYTPMPKALAKKKLGLDPNQKTILISIAGNLADTRKGVDISLSALPLLKHRRELCLLPLSITPPTEELKQALAGFQHIPIQSLTDRQALFEMYNAADVLWHPSRADTSSLTLLEAAVAGTPVIAARVGGVPELIRPNQTGVLIPPSNPAALAEATDALFQHPDKLAQMGLHARAHVENKHSLSRFLDAHEQLYQDVIASWHRRRWR